MAVDVHGVAPATDTAVATRRPRRRTALWVAVAVALVVALFVGVLATRDAAVDRQADSPLIGKPAPAVAGTALDDTAVALDGWRGRFVLVNFFATWCVPCREEHPELVAFAEQRAASGDVQVVSVIYDDEVRRVREFFERRGGDWPVVPDPSGRIALDYGVAGVPESFLVSPSGIVVAKLVGGVTAAGLDRLLTRAGAPA